MRPVSLKRHGFSPDVIRQTVRLHFRFTLSFRDVEEIMARRGSEFRYETIRRRTIEFGPRIARNLTQVKPARGPDPATSAWDSGE